MNIAKMEKVVLEPPVGFEKLQSRSGYLPIWNFYFPIHDLKELQEIEKLLRKLLKDIEEKDLIYDFNRVALIDEEAFPERGIAICVLPRKAFKGYVEDMIDQIRDIVIKK